MAKNSFKPARLSDIIQIRNEGEFGFVRNRLTGIVFYADAFSLEFIENIKNKPMEQVVTEFPNVLKELGYTNTLVRK